jgi:uncharacterized protein involved in tolerance to divalent cations
MPRGFLVTTSTPTAGLARTIARSLVADRLAACVQVAGPMTSTYRWQGRVETAREWLVAAKTTRTALPRLMKAVASLHTYDTPEIVALPIVAGSDRYLAWLRSSVTSKASRDSR